MSPQYWKYLLLSPLGFIMTHTHTPSPAVVPPPLSLVGVTGRGGAPYAGDEWSGWSLPRSDPPKKRQNTSQVSCHLRFRLLRKRSDLLSGHGEGSVEPLLERAAALEDGGQQKVEKSPEFRQFILQRRTCEQHAPRSQIMRVQHLRQFTVMILHTMTFVHYHVLPSNLYGATPARQRLWHRLVKHMLLSDLPLPESVCL